MADPPPAPAPQRPAAPVRSSSDSLPVDIYAQFGPRSREDEERELGKVPEEGRVSEPVIGRGQGADSELRW